MLQIYNKCKQYYYCFQRLKTAINLVDWVTQVKGFHALSVRHP